MEIDAGNVERAVEVLQEALVLDRKLGDRWAMAIDQHSLAAASLRAGRAPEAHDLLSSTVNDVVGFGDIEFLAATLELAAGVAAQLDDGLRAARLAGAAEDIREKAGMPIAEPDAALLERFLAPMRATISREVWDAELAAGRALSQQQAVTLVVQPVLNS